MSQLQVNATCSKHGQTWLTCLVWGPGTNGGNGADWCSITDTAADSADNCSAQLS